MSAQPVPVCRFPIHPTTHRRSLLMLRADPTSTRKTLPPLRRLLCTPRLLALLGITLTAFLLPACGGASSNRGFQAFKSTNAEKIPDEANPEFNTAAYDRIIDNPFLAAKDNPLS